MIYELKKYTPHKGKASALHKRFVNQTLPIFKRHNILISVIFSPAETPDQLWYVTCFSDDQARRTAWAGFQADAEWQNIKKQSDADGPLLDAQSTTILYSIEGAFPF
jgi:hypothetical protein